MGNKTYVYHFIAVWYDNGRKHTMDGIATVDFEVDDLDTYRCLKDVIRRAIQNQTNNPEFCIPFNVTSLSRPKVFDSW